MPRLPDPPPTASRHAELIARALAHVDAHLDQALTADVLADKAAMSRHHFHRVFHAYVGCSVGAYVIWRRLQRACALLASGREPVAEIAWRTGYDSAQSLAKAMRRELGSTPTAVRRGEAAAWSNLLRPWHLTHPPTGEPEMHLTRFATLPPDLVALTATARGMVDHNLTRAARQAFGELTPAIAQSPLKTPLMSWLSLIPDDPQGPDDPNCRYIAAVVFGYWMGDGSGQAMQPDVPLSGTLAWLPLAPGRCAVFTHVGPYDQLHRAWHAIYRDWLPASGEALRDAPPMELMLNSPQDTPPAELKTELWVPII